MHELTPSVLHLPEGWTVPALSFLLSNNPPPQGEAICFRFERERILPVSRTIKQPSECVGESLEGEVLPLGGCPFHPLPFQNGYNGVGGLGGMLLGGEEAEGMNMFPHPFIALYSSTNRSQHAFVSALLLPFFPSPLERANTFSFCQRSPLLCLCVRTRTSAYMRGLGRVLLVASSPVWPYLINTTRPCGCRMAASLKCLNSNLLYNEKLYDGMTHIIVILVFSSCPWQLQLILSAVSWTCLDDVVAAFFYFWLKSKRPGRIRMGKLPVQRCAS